MSNSDSIPGVTVTGTALAEEEMANTAQAASEQTVLDMILVSTDRNCERLMKESRYLFFENRNGLLTQFELLTRFPKQKKATVVLRSHTTKSRFVLFKYSANTFKLLAAWAYTALRGKQ